MIACGQFVPDNNHGDTPGQTDHDEACHVIRIVPQKNNRNEKHQNRADDPVLNQGKPQYPFVPEHIAHVLVPDLGKRRIHHQNEAGRNGNVGGAD